MILVISFYKLVVSITCWDVCWICKVSFHKIPWKIRRLQFYGFTWHQELGTFYKLSGVFIL